MPLYLPLVVSLLLFPQGLCDVLDGLLRIPYTARRPALCNAANRSDPAAAAKRVEFRHENVPQAKGAWTGTRLPVSAYHWPVAS